MYEYCPWPYEWWHYCTSWWKFLKKWEDEKKTFQVEFLWKILFGSTKSQKLLKMMYLKLVRITKKGLTEKVEKGNGEDVSDNVTSNDVTVFHLYESIWYIFKMISCTWTGNIIHSNENTRKNAKSKHTFKSDYLKMYVTLP